MKILGLIGGISWVSTVDYYKQINQLTNARLGGLNFAECIIYSFNYADIKKNNDSNNWESTFAMLLQAAMHLKASGATAIVLCANTMHLLADRLEAKVGLPVIHIATATAKASNHNGIKKAGLLGTKFTMELDFFKNKLAAHGIETIIPGDEDRAFVNSVIYDELGKGIVTPGTKARFLEIARTLVASGAEGIILGCTEIPLVIHADDVDIPVFDTALIHSKAAVEFALS